MRQAARLVVTAVLLCLLAIRALAADLQEHTRQAFDRYAAQVTEMFLERVRNQGASSTVGVRPAVTRILRDGQIVARAGSQDGIIDVSDGLVHHWFATGFIEAATLTEALNVSYAYPDYQKVYRPIIASRLLSRDGDTFRALLRLRESAGGMTAILDLTTRVQYFHPDTGSVYTISTSEDIREVKNAGSPRERLLPTGRDSGYLWRAVTLSRMLERDGGLLVEMETLGLSRSFPPLLGWIIEPIARRIGRKSVEQSVQEFRTAVHARTKH